MNFTHSGRADKLLDALLSYNDEEFDRELGSIGVYREVSISQPSHRAPTNYLTRYTRHGREIDVTSYGDSMRQSLTVTPGLHVEAEGTKRDGVIVGMILIAQERGRQIAALDNQLNMARKSAADRAREVEKREEMLLAIWDGMGKKRKASFTKEQPKTAKLMKELAEKRDHDAQMDAAEYDW